MLKLEKILSEDLFSGLHLNFKQILHHFNFIIISACSKIFRLKSLPPPLRDPAYDTALKLLHSSKRHLRQVTLKLCHVFFKTPTDIKNNYNSLV